MNTKREKQRIHLYFYTDSVGFPRKNEQSLHQSWPFLVKDLLEARFDVIAYPCMRGLGGATITEIEALFERDSGYYFAHSDEDRAFIVFNVGVVDSAPVPFTYVLRHLARIPVVGRYIWYAIFKTIHPLRNSLQRIYSYRRTSPGRFRETFGRMINDSLVKGVTPISVDTPIMPCQFEKRSPGLTQSIKQYNALKHSYESVCHLDMSWVKEEFLSDDGHHLNTCGHELLARKLFLHIEHLIEGSITPLDEGMAAMQISNTTNTQNNL